MCLKECKVLMTMATNYYGPFLLTQLLLIDFMKSDQSRIIVVSSLMYIFGNINPKSRRSLNPVDNLFPFHLYSGLLSFFIFIDVFKSSCFIFSIKMCKSMVYTRIVTSSTRNENNGKCITSWCS